MDEILFSKILRTIGMTAGIIGVLFGLDMIFGAKAAIALKRVLDRGIDVIEKTVYHSKRIFGFMILILSLIILFLISRATG